LDEEAIYDFPENTGDKNGLMAIGGNLSFGTLLNAYSKGIFPWYNPGEIIQWFSPDPRFVLFPEKIKIKCRFAQRSYENGTWISDEIEKAYTDLFKKGFAHSAEAWQNNQLVGGLYGVMLGKVFFGESMFADKSNASKFAFIKMVESLKKNGIELIDCQVYTSHLESLGAEFISRKEFNALLKKWVS
jgi:leucyl/phenylalanyl-tRNA--protein transferase